MIPYLLNLFDVGCTLLALQMGLQELNPFMQNVYFMIFYKVIVMGVLFLWLDSRPERIAKVGLRICTVVYALLAVWHVVGIVWIFRY